MAVVLAVFVCRRLGPFSGGLWRMAVVLAVFVCRRLGPFSGGLWRMAVLAVSVCRRVRTV